MPARSGLIDGDRRRVQAMAEFARRFPKSSLSIRAATIVGEDCIQRLHFEMAREWVAWMDANAAGSPEALLLAGKLRRAEAVGTVFAERLTSIDGSLVDLATLRGKRLAIAIWNSGEDASRRFAADLQRRTAEASGIRVVGVDLSESLEDSRRVAASLGLTWIQVNDRRGRGGEFVRKWGISDAPTLILVDEAGKVTSITGPVELREGKISQLWPNSSSQSQPSNP